VIAHPVLQVFFCLIVVTYYHNIQWFHCTIRWYGHSGDVVNRYFVCVTLLFIVVMTTTKKAALHMSRFCEQSLC